MLAHFLDFRANGLDVVSEDTTETVDRLPARAICRGAKVAAFQHFDLGAAQQMDLDMRLAILDVAGQPVHVFLVGLWLDDTQLGDADRDVISELDEAVKAIIAILVVEYVDDRVADGVPESAPELPGLVHTKHLLAVAFYASRFDVFVVDKLDHRVHPLVEERLFTFALVSSEHQSEKAGVHDCVISELLNFSGWEQGFAGDGIALDAKLLRDEGEACPQEILDARFAGNHGKVDLLRACEVDFQIVTKHGCLLPPRTHSSRKHLPCRPPGQ